MSVQDQLAPYLNRFDILLRNNENASLEITCNKGNVVVNLKHKLEKTIATDNFPTLFKYVKPSQFSRLQKREIARAVEARKGLKEQQQIEENAKQELANYVGKAEKATLEAEHARQQAAKALQYQENAKAIQAKTELVEIKEQPTDVTEPCHVEITEYKESPVKQQTCHIKCSSCQKSFEN